MRISEVVILHPSVAAKSEFDVLLHGGNEKLDDIIAFIMDDNNPEARRISMLRHLDVLFDDEAEDYDAQSLDDFMFNQEGARALTGSPEEIKNFKKDMGLPPYHLSVVDETQDDDSSTGEYEICQRCDGEGCIECEEGLKDITGMHKMPDFDDLKNA